MTEQAAKVAAPNTVEEYLDEQAAEWGTYVAADTIYIDGVRAFNKGERVPASHVTRKVVTAAQVEKIGKGN
jgi:hypothetical protein